MYSEHIDLMLFAAAGLTLILFAMVGARRQKERAGDVPRYLGYIKPDVYRAKHGYDPVMTNWMPKRGTTVPRGGYGNE